VTSVEFSPDDHSLATTCIDGTIKLWDLRSKSEITTFKGHEMWVNNAVFLPDGRTLVSGSDDRNMKMWDASRPAQADAFDVLQAPESSIRPIVLTNAGVIREPAILRDDSGAVLFSPDSARLLAVDNRPVIQAWELPAQHLAACLAMPDDAAFTTAFFPDARRAATAGRDGRVRLWELSSGDCLAEFRGTEGVVTTLAISADGRKLAGAGLRGKLWVWDVPTRTLESTIPFGEGRLTALCALPDGRTWLAGLRQNREKDRLCRLDPRTKSMEVLPQPVNEWITGIVVSPDGTLIATSCRDSAVYLWRTATLQLVGTLRGHSGYTTSVAFSPDGLSLASASNDGTVKLWSVLSQLELATLPGHIAAGTRLSFSPDGTQLAACGEDGLVRIWRAPTLSTLP
jgi:WD40 repeat protein